PAVILRPVEHWPPAQIVRIAEADELQPCGSQYRVKRRAEKDRDDERGHVGQNLEKDDVEAALTPDPGGVEKLSVAQGERLRSQLACSVRPPGHGDDGDQ